jgi:hypothetical protein
LRISLIVSIQNQLGTLRSFIAAAQEWLAASTVPVDVLLVDDGSCEETVKQLRAWTEAESPLPAHCSLKLIRHRQPQGLGQCLQSGLDYLMERGAPNLDGWVVALTPESFPYLSELQSQLYRAQEAQLEILLLSAAWQSGMRSALSPLQKLVRQGVDRLVSRLLQWPEVLDSASEIQCYRLRALQHAQEQVGSSRLIRQKGPVGVLELLTKVKLSGHPSASVQLPVSEACLVQQSEAHPLLAQPGKLKTLAQLWELREALHPLRQLLAPEPEEALPPSALERVVTPVRAAQSSPAAERQASPAMVPSVS